MTCIDVPEIVVEFPTANIPHTHPISDIVDLQDELDGKSDVGHTHDISDITDLQDELDNKLGVDATTADVPDSANKRYVTDADQTNLSNLSGTNTGDETTSTILTKIGDGSKISGAYLPSYVDDVSEYANLASFPVTGETGKIYIATNTNKQYRWSGSTYVEISQSLALGETSGSAYRGDYGKIAYDHSQLTSGNPHNTTKGDVGLGNVDNTSDLNKPVSTAQQTALDAKVSKATAQTDCISGIIEAPSNGDYKIVVKAPFAGTIASVTTICAGGTATMTTKIDGVALTATANAVSASEVSEVPTANNTFTAGQDITLTFSSVSLCVNVSFTVVFTRTLA